MTLILTLVCFSTTNTLQLEIRTTIRTRYEFSSERFFGLQGMRFLGAFGKVFLCYDVDTGSELAIKQIPIRGLDSESSRVRYFAFF